MPVTPTQLNAIQNLTTLLQRGDELEGATLQEAVALAAEGGDVGAQLLAEALRQDGYDAATSGRSVTDAGDGTSSGAVLQNLQDRAADGTAGKPAARPAYMRGNPVVQDGDPIQQGDGDQSSAGGVGGVGPIAQGDKTPPGQPFVDVAFGDFVDPRPRRQVFGGDPLVMRFGNLEKGATLYFINRHDDLAAEKADKNAWVKIPWDGELTPEGQANLVASDKVAAKLGVHPGDVLEVFQTDAAGNVSDSAFVAINREAPDRTVNSPLGPGPTTFIEVEADAVLPGIRTHPDVHGAAVNPAGLTQRLYEQGGRPMLDLSPKDGALAFEPSSRVVIDNPAHLEGHHQHPVRATGDFDIRTADFEEGDAVVLRVLDHSSSWSLGQEPPRTERRLVITAGREGGVVVDNPKSATQEPIEAAPGLVSLSDGRIEGAPGAATPGSIVLIHNQSTREKLATAVGEDGSFARALNANIGDQISIQLLHAFDPPDSRIDLGIHQAGDDLRTLTGSTTPVGDNRSEPLRIDVKNAEMSFSLYNMNTGNRASVEAGSDWGGELNSVFTLDPDNGDIIVTMSAGSGDFRRDDVGSTPVRSYFGSVGGSNFNRDNRAPDRFRGALRDHPDGSRWPVRFVTDTGEPIGRGEMDVSFEKTRHGGSSVPRGLWTVKLDPSSYVAE